MKFLFSLLLAVVPVLLQGQNTCKSYIGKVVAPVTFDAAVARFTPFQRLPPKGEFETTAHYRARRNTILHQLNLDPLILATRTGSEFFVYDADAQQLRISRTAFSNPGGDDIWVVPVAIGLITNLQLTTRYNIYTVISSADQRDGTYKAANGFGAQVTVTRVNRRTQAIYSSKRYQRVDAENGPFPGKAAFIGSLSMNSSAAQALKPALRSALVVVPKEPFIATGTYDRGVNEVRSQVTEHISVLVADFRCGLVMNAGNKVLAAYPTL